MACHQVGAKPLSEPMLEHGLGTNFNEILIENHTFSFCLSLNVLTINVRGPSNLGLTKSIS